MKDIPKVINLLKKESRKWERPFVSAWGKVRKDAFTTMISCLLSLRTKDAVTAEASIRLLKKHDTPSKILRLGDKELEKLIYPTGFYKTKAKRIKEICRVLISSYNGSVPNDFNELLKLKGVGRKTAAIVMVYGFGDRRYIPVDTHVNRIPNRLGWIRTKTPEDSEKELMKIVPRKFWYDLNEIFVQFGQFVCLPVSPLCSKCVISGYCRKAGVGRRR